MFEPACLFCPGEAFWGTWGYGLSWEKWRFSLICLSLDGRPWAFAHGPRANGQKNAQMPVEPMVKGIGRAAWSGFGIDINGFCVVPVHSRGDLMQAPRLCKASVTCILLHPPGFYHLASCNHCPMFSKHLHQVGTGSGGAGRMGSGSEFGSDCSCHRRPW